MIFGDSNLGSSTYFREAPEQEVVTLSVMMPVEASETDAGVILAPNETIAFRIHYCRADVYPK